MIEPEQAQARLAGLVDAFAGLIAVASLEAPVPSCPGWTVDRLIRHLGAMHTWATGLILGSETGLIPRVAAGADRETLRTWYAAGAARLLDALAATDPAAVVTTFDDQSGPATFWFRRQLHETAMHAWDLGTAVGRDLGYDADLALDGIDEVATMFFPRQVRLGRIPPLAVALRLAPADAADRWTLSGDGTASADTGDATLRGPAEVLVLALWGRVRPDDARLEVDGDRAVAAAVLGASIVP